MNKSILRSLILLTIAVGLFLPSATADVHANPDAMPAAQAGGSLEGLLNPDGTLRLWDGYSGSLNVAGWNVQLDAERGPVFSAAGTREADIPTGNWAALGSGDGSAINDMVFAVATFDNNVYVAGNFRDLDNIDAADTIARWDGSTWSNLGADVNGYGALSGQVFALAVDSAGNLYAGGDFTLADDPAGRAVAVWNGNAWSALGHGSTASDPSIDNGAVYAIGVDSNDDVYVGGTFTDVWNGVFSLGSADWIAKWDGTGWSSLSGGGYVGASLNGRVNAIATDGLTVYVGGEFQDVDDGGQNNAADHIAMWQSNAWYNLGDDGAGDGSLGDYVTSLSVDSSGNLYVGGNFANVNNSGTPLPEADYVAKWTPGGGGNWSALGSDGASGGPIDDTVYAVLADGSNVYIGGQFNDVSDGGTALDAADYIARWNGTHWFAVGTDGAGENAIKGLQVRALASGGAGTVYAGGKFDQVVNNGDVLATSHLARWTGSAWTALGAPQGSLNGRVYVAAVSGTNVYVGGTFKNVADNGAIIPEADYIARWDGTRWHALGSNGHGDGALNGEVHSILVRGGNVFVGGYFYDVNDGGTPQLNADYIAVWDGVHWSGLGSGPGGDGSVSGGVLALAADETGNVYAGGGFQNVTNGAVAMPEADYVAKWDGSAWSPLGVDRLSNDGCLKAVVYSLAVSGSNVYAGGFFTDVVDNETVIPAADHIAKWDGTNWSALGAGPGGDGSLNGSVRALAVSGGDLYAGGNFVDVSNGATAIWEADYIAKWDGIAWSALGGGALDGSLNNGVEAVAILGPNVYVGGWFSDVNNAGTVLTEADAIAAWDGTNWSALGDDGGTGSSLGGPVDVGVEALAILGNDLYAGGRFWNVNNGGSVLTKADYLAAYGLPVLVATSNGTQDGWILESTETSGAGGTKNAGATAFIVGDEKGDKQYRSILSFNTSAIPDGATITSVMLKFKQTGLKGTNQFTDLGDILVDLKKGAFGTKATLQLGDFKAKASKNAAMAITNAPAEGWYTGTLAPGDLALVSKTGTTQFRLRFTKEDNDDKLPDYLKFASGNAGSSSRPVLIVTYTIP